MGKTYTLISYMRYIILLYWRSNYHTFVCLRVFDAANVQGLVTKGKLARDKADKALSLLKGVLDYTEFKDVDMVIEVGFQNSIA